MRVKARLEVAEQHPNTWMLFENLSMPSVGGLWIMRSSDDAEGTYRLRGEQEPEGGDYIQIPTTTPTSIPGRPGMTVHQLAEWEAGEMEFERS